MLLDEKIAPELTNRFQAHSQDYCQDDSRLAAAAWNVEGINLSHAGHHQEAIAAFVKAVELKADFADAWCHIAEAAATLGEDQRAIELFLHSLSLEPKLARAYMGLGTLAEKHGQVETSANSYRRAFALRSTDPATRQALGTALARIGDPMGVAMLESLVVAYPGIAEAHYSLALSLLLQGRYPEGWQEHEWRMQLPRMPTCQRSFSKPLWQGEALEGRSILLYAEQGFGDTIQFARYAPLVAERGGQVILEAQPGLQRLLSRLPGVTECVAKGVWDATGAERLGFSVYAPLLSLPLIFGTDMENVPPPVAPTMPPRDAVRRDGVQIGLVWGGDPRHSRDHLRSIPLAAWKPLAAVQGAVFTSLQKGVAEAELDLHGEAFRFVERCAEVQDFADTARVVAELDLVITVDTAMAHLAGTLGKPVWLLLPPLVDWRWGLAGETTPWYPTARLFRRSSAAADWSAVFGQVAEALRQLVADRST